MRWDSCPRRAEAEPALLTGSVIRRTAFGRIPGVASSPPHWSASLAAQGDRLLVALHAAMLAYAAICIVASLSAFTLIEARTPVRHGAVSARFSTLFAVGPIGPPRIRVPLDPNAPGQRPLRT